MWAAVGVLRRWLTQYGVPRALYTDWKNVYVRPPNAEERETGAAPLTQFGRRCAALGIQIIPASSPQAKGRIERNHGTHQDRLVKELQRDGIRDLAVANTFLASHYWADHNARFTQPPADAGDFHVRVPPRIKLADVVRLETPRVVANDWVVRYHNRLFQLERRSPLPPARSTVLIYERSRRHHDPLSSRARAFYRVEGTARGPGRAAPRRPATRGAFSTALVGAVRRSSVATQVGKLSTRTCRRDGAARVARHSGAVRNRPN